MASKMLIDASHPEETRVVVMRGNRVEEFDFESANRKQLRGNIYLAKVTRVEPSLQAAFVDYGGNRHGFLAFSEIHPDYYQIPIADRQALIAAQERDERDAEAEAEHRARRRNWRGRGRNARRREEAVRSDAVEGQAPGSDQQHEAAPFSEQPAEHFAQDAAPTAHEHDSHDHHDHVDHTEGQAEHSHTDHEAHHEDAPAELPTSEAEFPAAPAEMEAVTENNDAQESAPSDTEQGNGHGDDHHEE